MASSSRLITTTKTNEVISMRFLQGLLCSLTAGFVLFCGCGGNGVKAPSALSYTTITSVYTKGVQIAPDSPTSSGGTATAYSVSPALPAGLVLSASTGVVSGTPTAVTAPASYTVTATNSAGSTTATLSITVNDQPPSTFSYATDTAAYTVDAPITENGPTNSGGTVISYSVSPALPAGLSLSATTGIISGTPTAVTALASYTVTATNSGGSATAALSIAVNAAAVAMAPAAPAGLAYDPGNAVYTVGVPIPENVPTSIGGPPTSYSVSPALPAGLRLSTNAITLIGSASGIISGTPTAASAATAYTVTASNAAGSTTATLTITVNAAALSPAGLAYGTPAPVYAAGVSITPDVPSTSSTGGAPASYSVSPDLPAGLSLDPVSGIVSGTPSAPSSTIVPPPPFTATYMVTASNAAGSITAPLTITIYSAPQAVPNLSQSITPLATAGSSFQFLDTGMTVTDTQNPQVAPQEWMAGQAVSTSVSPDGKTLLVLTSGYNRVFQGPFPLFDPLYSNEYVFIYDISNHAPVFKQTVSIPNAYHGIVWDPSGQAFYVSGGMGDAPISAKIRNQSAASSSGLVLRAMRQSGSIVPLQLATEELA
jgi:hypothetical protein